MVKKWEIYFIDLDPAQSSEQKGIHPVLIISNDAVNMHLPICTVIPFSSYRQGAMIYPTEVLLKVSETGLPKDSILMIQQIRTVTVSRLKSRSIGLIKDDDVKNRISTALSEYFEL